MLGTSFGYEQWLGSLATTDRILGRGKLGLSLHRYIRDNADIGIPFRTGILTPFFIRPHVKVHRKLRSHNVSVTLRKNEPPYAGQTFDAIIWTIEISKKYRKSAILRETAVTIKTPKIKDELPLVWRREDITFHDCQSAYIRNDTREAFLSIASSAVIGRILRERKDPIDLRPNDTVEIYFLLTLKETRYAYYIFDYSGEKMGFSLTKLDDQNIQALKLDGVPAVLPYGSSAKFTLHFRGLNDLKEKQIATTKLSLRVNDYDNISVSYF